MISDDIARYVQGLDFSFSEYSMSEVQLAIKRLINDQKLAIKTANGCPTVVPFQWYMGELFLEDKKLKSTGEGFNKNTAQMRCVGELFERIPIYTQKTHFQTIKNSKLIPEYFKLRNSNGLSFALNIQDGIFNAYRELVERHVVLDYWYNKKFCEQITGFNKWNLLNKTSSIKNKLQAKLYNLPNNYGLFVICAHLSNRNFPPYNIYGYGCHENQDKAIEKAFLEAWRFYWEFNVAKEKKDSGKLETFLDHFFFHAFHKDIPPSYTVGPIKNPISPQKFKFDQLYVFDLKEYEIPGYCIKLIRDDFWEFIPGPLSKDIKERKHGEVHPVA